MEEIRPGLFAFLASLIVLGHLGFVVFACVGGALALRWPRVAWIHVPAAAWAVFVELTGRLCPLTPLENALRRRAGLDVYSGDFIANYVFPVLYPAGLTRDAQVAMGVFLLLLNAAAYGLVLSRRGRPRAGAAGPNRDRRPDS